MEHQLNRKKMSSGALVTVIVTVILLVAVIVLENTMNANSMLFTVLKKAAVYSLVAVSLNLVRGCFPWGKLVSCCWAPIPTVF